MRAERPRGWRAALRVRDERPERAYAGKTRRFVCDHPVVGGAPTARETQASPAKTSSFRTPSTLILIVSVKEANCDRFIRRGDETAQSKC
ncbi:hypothetical protein EVAR_61059_1 [Eumeta japonica]|uniref:Uncharacterized protein n=1 Tax=Eumeta variegata TaxID=151549 RepID=A0A4C1ZAP3_EUMVA|nr:hypothetical protein EVAR_61059_1 [Eumeta japonica]